MNGDDKDGDVGLNVRVLVVMRGARVGRRRHGVSPREGPVGEDEEGVDDKECDDGVGDCALVSAQPADEAAVPE